MIATVTVHNWEVQNKGCTIFFLEINAWKEVCVFVWSQLMVIQFWNYSLELWAWRHTERDKQQKSNVYQLFCLTGVSVSTSLKCHRFRRSLGWRRESECRLIFASSIIKWMEERCCFLCVGPLRAARLWVMSPSFVHLETKICNKEFKLSQTEWKM